MARDSRNLPWEICPYLTYAPVAAVTRLMVTAAVSGRKFHAAVAAAAGCSESEDFADNRRWQMATTKNERVEGAMRATES